MSEREGVPQHEQSPQMPEHDDLQASPEHDPMLEQFRAAVGENLAATLQGVLMGEDYNDQPMTIDPLTLFLDMSDERPFAELSEEEQSVIVQAISEQFGIPMEELMRDKSDAEREASVPLAEPEPEDAEVYWHHTRHDRVFTQEWQRPKAAKEWTFIKISEDRLAEPSEPPAGTSI